MTTCERCGTQNSDGSRYCDECGAALWLAGRPSIVSPAGEQSNGADRRRASETQAAVAQGAKPSGSLAASPGQSAVTESRPSGSYPAHKGAHATLMIERGKSAGKQFLLSNDAADIGRW